ncbi:transcriptional regulatory protein DevR (DosR) [mine drainage metagenome]|uniref:histidine kinase n=1 Tax=mine drainage metagenome TaxID=410659 RepID=A0A1J5R1W3_9ZZZZ
MAGEPARLLGTWPIGARASRARTEPATLDTLTALANDLAGEFRLRPLLERILASAVELLDCASGSICLIDQAAHNYRKEIDLDQGCQTGMVFSLDEGMTGCVARRGGPVIFERYSEVDRGHVDPTDSRYHGAVIGVPIRLGADLIGAVIVFASTSHPQFDVEDGRLLERFATHAAIAIANSRLHAEAAERAEQAAVSAERERSMLQIHDTIGRGLVSVMLELREAQHVAERGGDVTAVLVHAQRAVQTTLDEGRQAALGLGPTRLDARPLDETIALELEWIGANTGVTTLLRVFGDRREIAHDVRIQLVRIVQESLTNVAQHADATSVRVGLMYDPDSVSVIVEDDGRGFDIAADHTRTSGRVGLAGLVTRVAQLGGRVQIDSTRGWGTRIRAEVPYEVRPSELANTPRLRVIVAHDQPAMRAGLVRLLDATEPGVHVVAEVTDVAAAVDAVTLLHPAVVVAGMRLPGGLGRELIAALRDADPAVAVVGVIDDPTAEEDLRAWAAAGVSGLVPRDVGATSLGRAVLAAARGDIVVFGGLVEQLSLPPGPRTASLTTREREVRALVAQGLADKQIAARLGISVKTVEKHVSAVLRKAHVHSRTELMARRT